MGKSDFLNPTRIKWLLRRIYVGKSEHVGARQILRVTFLSVLTLSIVLAPFSDENIDVSQSPIISESPNPTVSNNLNSELQVSPELESQKIDLDYGLGKVNSRFTSKEFTQFKLVIEDLNLYLQAADKLDIKKMQTICRDLQKTDQSLLPIHQRVNNMSVIPAKYDQYWGLGSFFLFEGNLQCGKVDSTSINLLEDKKIKYVYGRALFYFEKIIAEGSANILPNQKQLDEVLLKESIAEEDAFFAAVDARVAPYYTKNAGFTDDEVKVLMAFRPLLTDYQKAFKTTNLLYIATACETLSNNYQKLRVLSSDSSVYEGYLDNARAFTFSGVENCKKGFKKNRINLLVEAQSDFSSSLNFIDGLIKFAGQLK